MATSPNDDMKLFADNLWEYFRPMLMEQLEHNIGWFRAVVTANPGGGKLTIQRPFDEPFTVKCVSSMEDAQVGTNVLVFTFGENLGTNAVVMGDADAHNIGGGGGGSVTAVPVGQGQYEEPLIQIANGGTGARTIADAVKNLEVGYRLGGWTNLGNNATQLTSVAEVIARANAVGMYKIFVSGSNSALTSTLAGISGGGILVAKWADTDRIDYLCSVGNKLMVATGAIVISTQSVSCKWVGGTPRDISSSYTLTRTGGTAGSAGAVTARRDGNVVHISLSVTTTAATASGSNLFTGTLSGGPLPVINTRLFSYVGGYVVIGDLTTTGSVTVRACGGSCPATTYSMLGTFITND